MGGSSKKVTVGYRYNMGLHMGLCHEPDALLELRVGDRTAWAGLVNEATTIEINAPNLFGGDEREGGVRGTCDVMMGRRDQLPNDYLAGVQGTPQPAYRGFLGLVYRGLVATNNPYLKNWSARVRSILRGWHEETPWYPERATIGMVAPDAASVYIALDCSGSMNDPAGDGTRLSNMKAAIVQVLDLLGQTIVAAGGRLDLRIQRFANTGTGQQWRNATAFDIDAAKSYVLGLTASGGTLFTEGLAAMPSFYAGGAGQRIAFLVTDGIPTGGQAEAEAARAILDSVPGTRLFAFNIDLEDIAMTAIVDNTPEDGVPVVAGSDPSALAAALANAILGGRVGMNPAHIIYQSLTDPDWGMGYPRDAFDDASFQAAANGLYAEGLGLALKWNSQTTIEEFTQVVADHAALVFGQDRRTGKFRMRLLRADYNEADLPVFTRHDVKVVRYQRPSLADTVNEIVIQYVDGLTGKEASTAPMQNLANIQGQGRVVSQTLNFPGVNTHQLASRVGMRELQARSTPLWRFSLEAKRRFASLLPGEPFVLDLSDTPVGVRLVMRAGDIDYGETADSVVRAECVEDVFAMPTTTYAADPGPGGQPPDITPRVGPSSVFEVPYTELVQTIPAAELEALPDDAGFVGAVALRPAGVPLNYALFTRMGAADFEDAATGDYAPGGVLGHALTRDPEDRALVLSSANRLDQLVVGSGAFLGDGPGAETVRIDAVDPATLTVTVARGAGDTVPSDWPEGTRLWGFDVEAAADPQQYVEGETVEAKVVNRTASGEISLEQAPTFAVPILSRQARPYPPADVRVNGLRFPTLVGTDLVFTWSHRDRVLQADTLLGWEEASVGPEPGATVTIRMTTPDESLVLVERTGLAGSSETITIQEINSSAALVTMFTERDGLESYQAVRWLIEFPILPIMFQFPDETYTPPDSDAINFQFQEAP